MVCLIPGIIKIYGWTKHFDRPVCFTSQPDARYVCWKDSKQNHQKYKSGARRIAIWIIHIQIFRNEFSNTFLIWTLTNCYNNVMIDDHTVIVWLKGNTQVDSLNIWCVCISLCMRTNIDTFNCIRSLILFGSFNVALDCTIKILFTAMRTKWYICVIVWCIC